MTAAAHPIAASRLASAASNMPAGYFAIVLGVAGLAGTWRAAALAWQLPASIGEGLYAVAGVVWAVLIVLYAVKALVAPAKLAAEAAHPVQCCYIGLVGVATMLIAGGLAPHAYAGAFILFILGYVFTLGFAVWRTGLLWHGERDHAATTAVLYLPAAAGNFVAAIVISNLGFPDWGQLAFGAAIFSWLAMESVLLHRLLTGPVLPPALRPTLGIQLAPPTVCATAYIAISGGAPDIFVHALIGYGLLQLLLLARLIPWIAQAGRVPGLWAFSFGAAAIATAPIRLVARGDSGAIVTLSMPLFVVANAMVLGLAVMTSLLLARGKLFAAA